MVAPFRIDRAATAALVLWGAACAGPAAAGLASRAALVAPPAAAVSAGPEAAASRGEVETLRIPEGGRMPRALVDAAGTVHLVHVGGGTDRANLFHVTRESGAASWSKGQRVNGRELSVAGVGPIDGAQFAIAPDNRLHVAWLQTEPVRFVYTRSRADGSGFEPPRELSTGDEGTVEAGPAVAADPGGNIFVFWHAGAGEDARRSVYVAVSRDGGTTFEPARRVSPAAEGACACCGLAAMSDADGAVLVSYRGAGGNVRRGQRLLTSTDAGGTFSDRLVHPWKLEACPVSTANLFAGPGGPTLAWETQGQVYFADVHRIGAARSPPGQARFRRKNPVVVVNSRGETLLAWGDGPGFSFGGSLHWQVFDAAGHPLGQPGGGADMILTGSVAAAVVQDDRFLVIF